MFASLHDISWLGVIAGVAAFAVLGGIYFVGLFPRQYQQVLGLAAGPPGKPGLLFIVGPMLCSLCLVVGDACLVRALGVRTTADAAGLGLAVAVAFLVPMAFNIAINPLFPRPLRYGLLNAPYFLIANTVACVLLVAIH